MSELETRIILRSYARKRQAVRIYFETNAAGIVCDNVVLWLTIVLEFRRTTIVTL